ncbi:hypothetical protein SBRCBS47491_009514 [Sporothrix bragantina]|uniref:Alpha/beta hydrolase fold-3 domain-containing protein n=1 Tax=Sporothrix bragantina TaxID=671064 RepID=A0ABP0CVY3_9PEZI
MASINDTNGASGVHDANESIKTNDEMIINPLHPSVEDKLDPKVKEIYNKYQAHRLRADQVTYEEFDADRARYIFPRDKVASRFCPVGNVTTHTLPVSNPSGEITVRIYRPTEEVTPKTWVYNHDKLPMYVNFHGGGFVLGGLDDDDPLCRQLCQTTPCIVANVAYRLAPEFPHPVPVTDSWAALEWLINNADKLNINKDSVAVGGLSAGGCLAAALAQMALKSPSMPPLVLQVLIVPVLDARYMPLEVPKDVQEAEALDTPYESYRSCAFAPMLPLERLVWFYRPWLGDDPATHAKNAADVRASPIVAADTDLVGLAPASMHVAEIDPLRSEAEAYHARLTALGISSQIKIYEGMVHPFAQWDGALPQGRELVVDIATALKAAFWEPAEWKA